LYQYTLCGLENIYLKNGYDRSVISGGNGLAIHELYDLHKVIAKTIINQAAPLSAKEFRFIRIELDLSQKAIGDLMDKTDQMIAKWEKGENKIPVLADKAIRDLYMDSIGEPHIVNLLYTLKDFDTQPNEVTFQFSITNDRWMLKEYV